MPAVYLDALKAAYARIQPTGADCELPNASECITLFRALSCQALVQVQPPPVPDLGHHAGDPHPPALADSDFHLLPLLLPPPR